MEKEKSKINLDFKQIIKTLDTLDKYYSDKIHNLELEVLQEKFVYLMARLFNPDFITIYLILILIYNSLINKDIFFVIKPLTHVLLSLIFTLVMKKTTARPRPTPINKVKRLYDLRQHEKNCSMPSGDSLQCANFCIILLFYFNTISGFFLLPLVMFARIFYFCHYILDTVIGAFLGLFISYVIFINLN